MRFVLDFAMVPNRGHHDLPPQQPQRAARAGRFGDAEDAAKPPGKLEEPDEPEALPPATSQEPAEEPKLRRRNDPYLDG